MASFLFNAQNWLSTTWTGETVTDTVVLVGETENWSLSGEKHIQSAEVLAGFWAVSVWSWSLRLVPEIFSALVSSWTEWK
jgi:hypothetical protein